MIATGPGGGVGGVGGGNPPQPPKKKPRIDQVRLVTCLSQKLIDLLGERGFAFRQYGDVIHFREREIEYILKLEYKKGEELAAHIAIFDKTCYLTIYGKHMTEAEEVKLVESLKGILVGEVNKLETRYLWKERGLEFLLDKYRSEIQALAAKPIQKLDGPWPKPLTAHPRIKQQMPKNGAAVPIKENGAKIGLADTQPHPAPVPSHEVSTKPIAYHTTLVQGKGKAAKLLFTGEQLAQALNVQSQDIVRVTAASSSSSARVMVEITVNAVTYNLSVTPLLATLQSNNPAANYSPLIKFLGLIFGAFNPRQGKQFYICTINWPKVEAFFAAKNKAAAARETESSAAAKKIAFDDTKPRPQAEKEVSVAVIPTTEGAPVQTEFEDAVKKWAQGQLVEWLKEKFHEFKLEEMTFSFSKGRLTVMVKATHQIAFKKDANTKIESPRALHFSLSVGDFGTFVRQIIPGQKDLITLQKALSKLGKSKASAMALHYVNLNMEKFNELIGTR